MYPHLMMMVLIQSVTNDAEVDSFDLDDHSYYSEGLGDYDYD